MVARSVALVVISWKDEGQRAKTRVMWSRFATPRSLGDLSKRKRKSRLDENLPRAFSKPFYYFLDIFYFTL